MKFLPAFCLLLLISCKHTQLSSRITTPVSVAQLRTDSARFHARSLDVDADGVPDELFWHKHGEGDSLFVFSRWRCRLPAANRRFFGGLAV